MQNTNQILMIRPVDFKFNAQTAVNNKFQQADEEPHSAPAAANAATESRNVAATEDKTATELGNVSGTEGTTAKESENAAAADGSLAADQRVATTEVQQKALKEFDDFVTLLRKKGVDVTVIDDTLEPETPDSIFPNNWISFHDGFQIFLYPMFSENRRLERRQDIIDTLDKTFVIDRITDMSTSEERGVYLEGTGSMVLDRENEIVYACLSVRTHQEALKYFCEKTYFTPVTFHAVDGDGFPIYHTNVMMCVADNFVVICLESIKNEDEKAILLRSFEENGKEVIEISLDQMNHFAGNMLQVLNANDEPLLTMSEQAYLSLNQEQITALEQYNELIYSPLYTIEKNGGGSARCMLAEIHLDKK